MRLAVIGSVLLLAGCATGPSINEQAASIRQSCAATSNTNVEWATCYNAGLAPLLAASSGRHHDLDELEAAKRLQVAEQLDARTITEAEAQMQIAQTRTQVEGEALSRDLMSSQAYAASSTALSNNLLLLNQSQYRPTPAINCYTRGPYTTCH